MANKKNPHAGHRARMRARYLKEGIGTFAPHELLEIILYHVVPRKNTNVSAHTLLESFGSLSGVLNASVDDLARAGLSESGAVYINMLPEILRVYQQDMQKESPRINSTEQVAANIVPLLRDSVLEEFAVICLDAKNRVLRRKVIKRGSPTKIDVSIREIAQFALGSHAASIVIGHSHPNGDLTPSDADKRFTHVLYETLMALDITLLEHLIVDETGKYFSFHKEGEMAILRKIYKEKYPLGVSLAVEDFKE